MRHGFTTRRGLRNGVLAAVFMLLPWLSATSAHAAPIGITYALDLTLLEGLDTLGLNGAHAVITSPSTTPSLMPTLMGFPPPPPSRIP